MQSGMIEGASNTTSYFPNVNIPSYNRFSTALPVTSSSSLSFSAPEADTSNMGNMGIVYDEAGTDAARSTNDILTNSDILNTLFSTNFSSAIVTPPSLASHPSTLAQESLPRMTQLPRGAEATGSPASKSPGDVPSSSNSKHSSSGGSLSSSATKSKSRRRGRTKSPKSGANLVCDICHQRYSRRDNLRTHQRVHSGEKPFQCKYCNTPFRWVSALRNHEALHTRKQAARKKVGGGKKAIHGDACESRSQADSQIYGAGSNTLFGMGSVALDIDTGNEIKPVCVQKSSSSCLRDSLADESLNAQVLNHTTALNCSSLSTTHSNSSSSNISYVQNSIRHARVGEEPGLRHDDISLSEIFGIADAEGDHNHNVK